MEAGDLWKLILLPVCLVLSALFSASETGFIALSRVRLMHLVNTGRPGAARASQLLHRPEKLLATVLLGNNLVNTAAAALATALAISLMDNSNLAVLVATVAVTMLLLVFGETVPKTLAWSRAETVAFTASRPLMMVGWVLSPAVRLLQGVSLLASKSMGITAIHSHITEEEIRTMISVGAQAGAVEPPEAEMLEKVFHFGDRQVQEIMTPRTEIVWVEKDATLEEFLRIYNQETHTRFPVYEKDIENIVGILSVKDVLQTMSQKVLSLGKHCGRRPAARPFRAGDQTGRAALLRAASGGAADDHRGRPVRGCGGLSNSEAAARGDCGTSGRGRASRRGKSTPPSARTSTKWTPASVYRRSTANWRWTCRWELPHAGRLHPRPAGAHPGGGRESLLQGPVL